MANEAAKGRRKPAFMCSAPDGVCNGRKCGKQEGKYHTNPDEVLACTARALIAQGYTRLTSRQFQPPGDGPILTLPKKPQRAKPGKTDNSYMSQPLKVRTKVLTKEEREKPFVPKPV